MRPRNAGRRHNQDRLLADGLALFSVGLGLAELVAPAAVARLVGVRDDADNRAVLKAAGLRELASGVGILGAANPAALLWGRVAGDVMDLLLLAGAASAEDSDRRRLSGATIAVLGVTALDVLGAARHSNGAATRRMHDVATGLPESLAPDHGVRVKAAITINRPREQVYARWRKLEDLPHFMSHLERVTPIDAVRSHWQMQPALGTHIEWDADVISDIPNKQISWRSVDGASIPNAGSVRFR
ncbi:MAG TPA: SRPBCC family protein, partial [Polyangiales bacterium]